MRTFRAKITFSVKKTQFPENQYFELRNHFVLLEFKTLKMSKFLPESIFTGPQFSL